VHRGRHWQHTDLEDVVEQRQTKGLVGFVVILLLLIASLFLVQQLRSTTKIEDCLMAGRRDCDALVRGKVGIDQPGRQPQVSR